MSFVVPPSICMESRRKQPGNTPREDETIALMTAKKAVLGQPRSRMYSVWSGASKRLAI